MALQLQNILTRKRAGGGEIQRQALIDGVTRAIDPGGKGGMARYRKRADELFGQEPGERTRDTQHAHAAPSRRRGHRSDGVGGGACRLMHDVSG